MIDLPLHCHIPAILNVLGHKLIGYGYIYITVQQYTLSTMTLLIDLFRFDLAWTQFIGLKRSLFPAVSVTQLFKEKFHLWSSKFDCDYS